jgi:hypothetical protein
MNAAWAGCSIAIADDVQVEVSIPLWIVAVLTLFRVHFGFVLSFF